MRPGEHATSNGTRMQRQNSSSAGSIVSHRTAPEADHASRRNDLCRCPVVVVPMDAAGVRSRLVVEDVQFLVPRVDEFPASGGRVCGIPGPDLAVDHVEGATDCVGVTDQHRLEFWQEGLG